MKLVTFQPPHARPRIGALVDGERVVALQMAFAAHLHTLERDPHAYPLAALRVPDHMEAYLAGGRFSAAAGRQGLAFWQERPEARGPAGEPLAFPLAQVRLLAPIGRPGKVIGTGNFAQHLAELNQGDVPLGEAARAAISSATAPVSFLKSGTTVVGPYDDVVYPAQTARLDYEVEIAIIIGREAHNVSVADALDYVAGYAVCNDLSARDIQFSEMAKGLLNLGKNLNNLFPLGPCIVTPDELTDTSHLDLRLTVNGESRLAGNTSGMMYNVAELVSFFSCMRLEPGDVVMGGSPPGPGAFKADAAAYLLKPGDIVEASITGIGTIRNRIVAP